MQTVNYFLIGEVFNLLERVELIDRVQFFQFNPDDPTDIKTIARQHIMPSLLEAAEENQILLARTLAHYSPRLDATCQSLRDNCQELSLLDPASWSEFIQMIAITLFGDKNVQDFRNFSVVEIDNEDRCFYLFSKYKVEIGV